MNVLGTVIRAGIDYSINSPALCICVGDVKITNCTFYARSSTLQHQKVVHPNIFLDTKLPVLSRFDKYDLNSTFILDRIKDYNIDSLHIEGYSYASVSSSALQMAENGGILRHKLNKERINFVELAPSLIKKSATGKGNAKKDQMYAAWLAEGGYDLMTILNTQNYDSNPLSDIVDSYFIMRAGSLSE